MQLNDHLVHCLLGSRYRRYERKIRRELKALTTCIKSTYLVDEGFVSAVKWAEFLGKLHDSEDVSSEDELSCVTLSHDTLVVNATQLRQRLKGDILDGFSRLVFVNISGHLHRPEVLHSDCLVNVQRMLVELLSRMEGTLFSSERISQASPITVPIGEDWNLATIFGWVLGYPVIYWFDQDSAVKGVNCLSMEPLLVHEVTLPEEENHTVWSFSVPTVVRRTCAGAVRAWWEGVRRSASDRGVCLSLSKKERILSDVAL